MSKGTVERFEALLPQDRSEYTIHAAKATFGVQTEGQRTDHLVLIHYPFLGKPLLDLAQGVSPTKGQDRRGIQDDHDMPRQAVNPSRDYENQLVQKEAIRLRNLHEQDPVIGKAFQTFVRDSLYMWDRALNDTEYDKLYQAADKVLFGDPKQFTEAQIRLMVSHQGDTYTSITQGTEEATRAFQKGIPFAESLSRTLDHSTGLFGYKLPAWLVKNDIFKKFENLKYAERKSATATFLSELDPDMAKEFVLHFLMSQNHILVTPEQVVGSHSNVFVTPKDEDTASLRSNEATLGITKVKDTEPGLPVPGRITGFSFPESYWRKGLWPVMAWTNEGDTTQSRFTDRNETYEMADRMGIHLPPNADTAVGQTISAAESRAIINKWARTMPLKGGRYNQSMQAVQAGMRSNLDDHAKDLFSEANGLFQTFESRIAEMVDS